MLFPSDRAPEMEAAGEDGVEVGPMSQGNLDLARQGQDPHEPSQVAEIASLIRLKHGEVVVAAPGASQPPPEAGDVADRAESRGLSIGDLRREPPR